MTGKRPRLLSRLLILALVAGLIYWWANAMTNEDPLWFLRSFKAQADWIIVYWDGDVAMCFPGDSEYAAVVETFADAIGHWSGYAGDADLPDEVLEGYRSQGRLLELHYNQPVRVHTRHLYPPASTFFVPLAGTHASRRAVFAGLTDTPRVGGLMLSEARFEALHEAVEAVVQRHQLQVCPAPLDRSVRMNRSWI